LRELGESTGGGPKQGTKKLKERTRGLVVCCKKKGSTHTSMRSYCESARRMGTHPLQKKDEGDFKGLIFGVGYQQIATKKAALGYRRHCKQLKEGNRAIPGNVPLCFFINVTGLKADMRIENAMGLHQT